MTRLAVDRLDRVDHWKRAAWPGRDINPDDSTASIDLERHGITGHECEPGRWHSFPIWRYSGTLTALADFLAEQYDDGSGETSWELLARLTGPWCEHCGSAIAWNGDAWGDVDAPALVYCPWSEDRELGTDGTRHRPAEIDEPA